MGASLNYKVENGKPELSIYIENNISFFPGEQIKGKLMLKSANLLKDAIIIYEIYSEEKYITKNNIEKNKLTKVFYTSLQYNELINFSISNGIYIPFNIEIPKKIFPSFLYSLPKNNGVIKNFLQITIKEFNLQKQHLLIIKKPFISLDMPLTYSTHQNYKLLKIFNKKSGLSLEASYKKNCYNFLNEIFLNIHIINNNKYEIKKLNIQLIRTIIFKEIDNNKNLNEFNDVLFENNININKKNDINFDVILKIEEPESIFNKYKLNFNSLDNLNIKDKSKLIYFLPTINSNLFKCDYIIKIEGICDYSIIPADNLVLTMPVIVCHQNELEKDNFEILLKEINGHIGYQYNKPIKNEKILKDMSRIENIKNNNYYKKSKNDENFKEKKLINDNIDYDGNNQIKTTIG